MEYSLIRTVAPTLKPLSVADVKAHLGVSVSEFDAQLESLLNRAIEWLENRTDRALLTQTWRVKLDRFPSKEIALPRAPLQSVSSIQYVDTDGATQTWSSSSYDVDTDSEPGVVRLAWQESFPQTRAIDRAITIDFVAGWTAAVPEAAIGALLLWIENEWDCPTDARQAAAEALADQLQYGVML